MKFYHYNQNNSGGKFSFDEAAGITHHVIIEAKDEDEANGLAERIGIYFDGVDLDRDCACCGDRWYRPSEYDSPSVYGEPIDKPLGFRWMQEGKEICVHYKDGRKEWY